MRGRRLTVIIFFAILVSFSHAQAEGEKDVEGGQDHPLLSRMPGYYLESHDIKDFDVYDISAYLSGADAAWKGKITKLGYTRKKGAKPVSMAQVAANYENAVRKIGGKILSSDGRVVNAKIEKGGAVTYVQSAAFNDGQNYELVIVETKPMEQEVTADASALNQSITATGKAVVYGIYFDTGKSEIKPESTPTLDEITKLLKENPRLKLYVVGHTDDTGNLESNLKLSSDRAAAVAKALTGRGIEASRLKPAGVGPYCPVDTNRTEEGKAKNRRVELVEHK
ncbi:MAG TPA: OmpA family protein [Thermodesulfovibrionales bacterium]|nr:OmpA family protein [Thermodesulfovibrionales bacterium]